LGLSRDHFVTSDVTRIDQHHGNSSSRATAPRATAENSETEREYWRREVIAEAFDRTQIKNIIAQDLRPVWKVRGSELKDEIPPDANWREMTATMKARHASGQVLPSVQAYEEALLRTVRDTLRFRQDDEAAPWAVKYLRRSVEARLPDEPLAPDPTEAPPSDGQSGPFAFWPNGEPAPLFESNLTLQAGPH
jgi:hypothetical protein